MKKLLFLLTAAITLQVSGQQRMTNIAGLNVLLHLPVDYNVTPATQKYPLIIVLQGSGPSDSASACHEGLTGKIAGGWNAEQQLPDGSKAKFITVSLVDHNYGWPYLDQLVNFCIKNYKVDTNHIIGTGLSQGATDLMKYKLNLGTPSNTARYMKILVLVSTPSQSGITDASFIGTFPTVAKFITGSADPIAQPSFSQSYSAQFTKQNIAASNAVIIAGGGHDPGVWDAAYDTKGSDSSSNVFIWAMQVNASGLPPAPIPVVTPAKTIIKKITITIYSDGTTDLQ